MLIKHFNRLHAKGFVKIPKSIFKNDLPSDTDPTQDCPISRLQFAANGLPINVTDTKLQYTNLPIEKMTAINRRLRDNFDVVGELQKAENDLKNNVKRKKNEKV